MGPLDEDGTANGVIVDPVGLGEQAPAAPNTGLAAITTNPILIVISTTLVAAALVFGSRKISASKK